MKCPDCEQKVDKLTRAGICKQCAVRINQLNYQNRKNGENKPYIPLKKLKVTDPVEYSRVMGRRNKGNNTEEQPKTKTKSKETIIKKTIKIEDNNLTLINRTDFDTEEDIAKAFASKGLTLPKDTTSILNVCEQVDVLLHNYIGIYQDAEGIFNKLNSDYKHTSEYYGGLYRNLLKAGTITEELNEIREKRDYWIERQYALDERRRGIKNVLTEYDTIGHIFTDLSKDKVFMKKWDDAMVAIRKIADILAKGNYRAELSESVQQEDFCYGNRANSTASGDKRYKVTVPTIYGNNRSEFVRTAVARTPEDAIDKVERFLLADRDKFRFTWKRPEIKVELISSSTEQECL